MAPEPEDPTRAVEEDTAAPPPPEAPLPGDVPRHDQPVFKLRGAKERLEGTSFLQTKAVRLTCKAEFAPGLARAGCPIGDIDVAADDVIEIEFENGARTWLQADDYYRRFGRSPARDAAGRAILEAPGLLPLLPVGMQARGPVSWMVKSLKVLGIDLAKKTAVELAKLVEKGDPDNPEGCRKRPGPGLYRCAMATDGFCLTRPEDLNAARQSPYLIFIHGTASSTWGSFGDLWAPARKAELDVLRAIYGDRILAFEHATLSKSPIENALELARTLPGNARLHLVTHSRGGLIGELLCRAAVVREIRRTDESAETIKVALPFQEDEFRLFERDRKYSEASDQLKLLRELDRELKDRQFKVERFVRVACPALGTTLASGRLDRWLSMLGSLAGAALPDTPLADMFKDIGDFVAAAIKEHTDPAALPGLEAMMPDSALIRLINWPGVTVPGDLAVIAGDIDPEAWWARLLIWVSDRFYEGDHDLVVNTPSMYGGAKRSGKALVNFNKGPEVNHFRYFQNQSSAQGVVSALTAQGDQWDGFEPLRKPAVDIARAVVLRSAEPRPVVFVLPGIMGSELDVGDDHVWLDVPDLIFGGFQQLRIDARDVRATKPFARYYGEIIRFLAGGHKVVPFPYDWRLPVEQEADRLAVEVRREFDQAKPHNKPVRFLAHSMGGLVARAMIARHESLWREICAVPGARLVMLGTPNGGSHAITELLVAQSATLRQLALLDITHSKKQLLKIISRFPGVLAMLPKDYRDDYFAMQTWCNYHEKDGKGWVLPQEKDIAGARQFRQLLDNAPVDPGHMVYVAGHADVTPAEMYLDTSGNTPQIKFFASIRGDGRVTWDSGIPDGVPTWYMNVQHGDLAAHEQAFQALGELLEQGKTSLLPQTAPVSRAAAVLFPMPPVSDELYPDQDVLAAAVLGAGPRKHRKGVAVELPLQVSVVHGNLAFASYPVAVGHYAGDTIVSAERQLDSALSNTLTQRYQLGIYPGALESSAVFFNPKSAANPAATPKGAIVVGLGTVGNLSAAALTRTFTRALLEYVTEASERQPQSADGNDAGRCSGLGVSVLLIGTGTGGISVTDSVFALLVGIRQANRALSGAGHAYRIQCVEFLELFEDRALQAVKALSALRAQPSLQDRFSFDGRLLTRGGGLRRVTYEEPEDWWQRLQIQGGATGEGGGAGTLRFSASTRRARAEVRLLATQRALVDQFVAQSIRTTRDSRAAARTLFELLLPNEIKEQAPDQDDLVLIVDEQAARYPWELLEDRWSRSGAPFVIEHGLLRQLESEQFRESVVGVTRNNALVIGDPVSTYQELKGAQEEAKAVARALRSDGAFAAVTEQIRPTTQQVVNALFADDYRLLHLAGHGVYRMTPKEVLRCRSCGQQLSADEATRLQGMLEPVTGMIIGDDVVLSPKEVHQMRHVPELVFVNCCHLGCIEGGGERNDRDDYNKIAANVATELIRIGVRAVVAAGWAVDDAAAATFAAVFYEQMLKGRLFGDAVKDARKATYDRHPDTNTWGAYQCYGDPGYRLVRKDSEREARPGPGDFMSPSEALVELDNIAARLAAHADRDTQAEVERIKAVLNVSEAKGWLQCGGIRAAAGRAFAEAKWLEEALTHYEQALNAEDAAMTVKDFEQLANVQGRQAVRLWAAGRAEEANTAIETAIRRLESIPGFLFPETTTAPEDFGLTPERLSMLGSAYKRKAWVSETERKAALEKMRNYYEQAFKLAEKHGQFDPYPLLNWLTAEMVVAWQEGTVKLHVEKAALVSRHIEQAKSELAAALKKAPTFWTAVMLADAALIEALSQNRMDEPTLAGIADRYREARRLGSPREFESAVDQLDFLTAMAAPDGPAAKALASLRHKLG